MILGVTVGDGVILGVIDGVILGVTLEVGVTLGVFVGVTVGVGVLVGVTVGVGAFSNESYIEGLFLSFQPNSTNHYFVIGLTENKTPLSQNLINYGAVS